MWMRSASGPEAGQGKARWGPRAVPVAGRRGPAASAGLRIAAVDRLDRKPADRHPGWNSRHRANPVRRTAARDPAAGAVRRPVDLAAPAEPADRSTEAGARRGGIPEQADLAVRVARRTAAVARRIAAGPRIAAVLPIGELVARRPGQAAAASGSRRRSGRGVRTLAGGSGGAWRRGRRAGELPYTSRRCRSEPARLTEAQRAAEACLRGACRWCFRSWDRGSPGAASAQTARVLPEPFACFQPARMRLAHPARPSPKPISMKRRVYRSYSYPLATGPKAALCPSPGLIEAETVLDG